MKILLISIILYLTPSLSLSNEGFTPDTCFTIEQIKNIYYKIQYLEKRNETSDTLINLYDKQIFDLKKTILIDSLIKENKTNQINLLNEKNQDLEKAVEDLKPRWYNDKTIWFGLGVLLSIIGYSI
jgi:hypothetical protein